MHCFDFFSRRKSREEILKDRKDDKTNAELLFILFESGFAYKVNHRPRNIQFEFIDL